MADNDANKDVKLGTAADEPAADPKTDMNRYYYRPGTTEPELRPEIAAAEAQKAARVEAEPAEASKPLRGKLPEDFPGASALEAAGVTTYAGVRKQLESLEDIDGIGPATAEKIHEAMGESSEEEEEAE
jgi:hypothetical protein